MTITESGLHAALTRSLTDLAKNTMKDKTSMKVVIDSFGKAVDPTLVEVLTKSVTAIFKANSKQAKSELMTLAGSVLREKLTPQQAAMKQVRRLRHMTSLEYATTSNTGRGSGTKPPFRRLLHNFQSFFLQDYLPAY